MYSHASIRAVRYYRHSLSHLLATERTGDVVNVLSPLTFTNRLKSLNPSMLKGDSWLRSYKKTPTFFFLFKVYTRNPKLYLSEES